MSLEAESRALKFRRRGPLRSERVYPGNCPRMRADYLPECFCNRLDRRFLMNVWIRCCLSGIENRCRRYSDYHNYRRRSPICLFHVVASHSPIISKATKKRNTKRILTPKNIRGLRHPSRPRFTTFRGLVLGFLGVPALRSASIARNRSLEEEGKTRTLEKPKDAAPGGAS
jgi:hypothetical protein